MPGLLFYPSVVVTVVLMLRRRDLVRWPDWVLVAAMAFMGAWAIRGVAWWALAMVFVLAGVLASERPVRAPRASIVNGFIAVVLGVAIVAALPWWRPADPLTGRAGLLSYAPSGLAAKVSELAGPGARVVVPQTWGSWFEWAAPEQAYFIDSRFELFPADVWADERCSRRAAARHLGFWIAGVQRSWCRCLVLRHRTVGSWSTRTRTRRCWFAEHRSPPVRHGLGGLTVSVSR